MLTTKKSWRKIKDDWFRLCFWIKFFLIGRAENSDVEIDKQWDLDKGEVRTEYNSDIKEEGLAFRITFKNLVNNIEIIYDNMSILRIKGNSLPILINISFQYKNEPIVIYFINNKETKYENNQKFLFDAKNNIINKLDKIYKEKTNLRFIYGKQFDSLMKHIEGTYKIDSIIRLIINDTNNQEIKDGYLSNSRNTDDYVYEYDLYNNNSFKNISDYISSFF